MKHGRIGTYTNYGCRCEPCREANTRQMRSWRARVRLTREEPADYSTADGEVRDPDSLAGEDAHPETPRHVHAL